MKKNNMKGLDRAYHRIIGDMYGYLSTKGLNETAKSKLRSDLIAMAKEGQKQGKKAEEVFTASPIMLCDHMAEASLKASFLEKLLFVWMLIGISLFFCIALEYAGGLLGIYGVVDKGTLVFQRADIRIMVMAALLVFIGWLWMGKQSFSSGLKKYGGFAVLYILGIVLAEGALSFYAHWPLRLPLLPVLLGVSLLLAVTVSGYYGYSRYRYQKQQAGKHLRA